jgi:LPS sulfotransferase NodH
MQGAAVGLEDVFPDFATLQNQGFAGVSCNKPTIMIAITPRTGSTLLCTALHQAGHSNEPNEIFNPNGPARQEAERRGTGSFAAYMASFARDPDPAFIFKIGCFNARPLANSLTRLFPQLRVVYLDRRNIAAQAVSQFRAELSGTWHARPGQPHRAFDWNGKFDLAHICAIIRIMEQEKRDWEAWFVNNNITPLRLDYRQLETSLGEAVRQIADTMNLPLRPEAVAGGGVLKLADELSADWTERVQKHLYNLS